jgi:dipeptide/tripeptide permease
MDDTFTTAPAPVVAFLDGKHSVEIAPHHEYGYAPGQVIPTDEEPWTSYLLCGVEFAERASYYGCKQVFKNFIRAPLPEGGNGAGAPPRGSQHSAGALGKGTVIASAMTDAFTFLAYAL